MRIVLIAVIVALSAAPALAEVGRGVNPYIKQEADEKAERAAQADKEYKAMIKNIPDQKQQNNDPWGDVRAADPASAKGKKKAH
jgi:hypothetical protein